MSRGLGLWIALLLAVHVSPPATRADEPPAVKEPAKEPAKPLAPKDVFPKAINAMVRGDLAEFRSHVHSADEQARKVAGWMEDVAKAAAAARKATITRFGEGAKKELEAAGNALGAEELAAMTEEVDGETATVWLGDREVNDPIPLRKVDGAWKLDIALLIRQETWSPDKMSKETTSAVERLTRLRDKIEKGDVTTAEAAARAIRAAALGHPNAEADEQEGL